MLLAISGQAQAQGWNCADRVNFPDGWSIMDQLYFEASNDGPAGPANIGPLFHVSRGSFYANWYPGLKAFDAPFVPPSTLSFVVSAEPGTKAAFGEFTAPSRAALKIAVTTSNPGKRGTAAQVLFQPKDIALNGILLEQQAWSVRLTDQRDRTVGLATYRFPFALAELSVLYSDHVAAIRKRAASLDRECSEPEDIEPII
jgi:hypothetical protein